MLPEQPITSRLLLDACCLINILASGKAESIIDAFPYGVSVSFDVTSREIIRYAIAPHVDSHRLTVVEDISEEEARMALSFASALGADGEAFTGALCLSRRWTMACDENRVLRFFSTTEHKLRKITTPEIIAHWIRAANPGKRHLPNNSGNRTAWQVPPALEPPVLFFVEREK